MELFDLDSAGGDFRAHKYSLLGFFGFGFAWELKIEGWEVCESIEGHLKLPPFGFLFISPYLYAFMTMYSSWSCSFYLNMSS